MRRGLPLQRRLPLLAGRPPRPFLLRGVPTHLLSAPHPHSGGSTPRRFPSPHSQLRTQRHLPRMPKAQTGLPIRLATSPLSVDFFRQHIPLFLSSYFRVPSSYRNFLSSYRNLPSFYRRNARKSLLIFKHLQILQRYNYPDMEYSLSFPWSVSI